MRPKHRDSLTFFFEHFAFQLPRQTVQVFCLFSSDMNTKGNEIGMSGESTQTAVQMNWSKNVKKCEYFFKEKIHVSIEATKR